jgi:ketosteroid isomerase-like protein
VCPLSRSTAATGARPRSVDALDPHLEAYRRTWDLFYESSRDPVAFDIVDLNVTAGSDVAFVAAIIRCSERDRNGAHPELKVRLTMGLRRIDGDWRIVHEHHSIPDRS